MPNDSARFARASHVSRLMTVLWSILHRCLRYHSFRRSPIRSRLWPSIHSVLATRPTIVSRTLIRRIMCSSIGRHLGGCRYRCRFSQIVALPSIAHRASCGHARVCRHCTRTYSAKSPEQNQARLLVTRISRQSPSIFDVCERAPTASRNESFALVCKTETRRPAAIWSRLQLQNVRR